ncbi:MAG: SGNH/GDSL hydrolase family protein [Kiritimatiellae bacterium]|nr:SGNH/GDSL hydrolase family protein [Kiritimatiellia bacterium]
MNASQNDSAAAAEWRRYDAASLPMEGRGWDLSLMSSPYGRLPAALLDRVPPDVRALQRCSAGLCLLFRTDSPSLRIRWKLGDPVRHNWNIPSSGADGVDVYQERGGVWRFARPPFPVMPVDGGAEYEWRVEPGLPTRVYLPTYNVVEEMEIAVPPGCAAEPVPPPRGGVRKPAVFYGTSITQGASASHPGGCWVAMAARKAGVPAVNFGFSGSGKMEDEMIDAVGGVDASLYVLDTVSNMTADLIRERMERFVRGLAERRPGVPILLLANRYVMGAEARARDAGVRAAFDRLRSGAGTVPGLHFAGDDAAALAPDDDGTVDGVHLNDLGMKRAGEHFGDVVRAILEGRES